MSVLPRAWLLAYRVANGLAMTVPHASTRALKGWHTGLWMGLTSRDTWQRLNAVYYAGNTRYMRDADNLEGLTPVEDEMCRAHVPPGASVLVAGAGGGREIWALAQAGYRAEGFECNEALVAYGNDFLQRHGVADRAGRIHHAPPDVCPDLGSRYDAVLIGWGVYIHVSPSPTRVAFLEQVKRVLKPGGRIIVGFCDRTPHAAYFRHIDAIARRFNRDLELGDKLEPTFEHHFTPDELTAELQRAGFRPVAWDTRAWGQSLVCAEAAA